MACVIIIAAFCDHLLFRVAVQANYLLWLRYLEIRLLPPARPVYYNETYLFCNPAKVLAVTETEVDEKRQISVVLDQTVMHPQGGEID